MSERKFSAPGRTELAGNHTDHNHGKVIAASIQLSNNASVQKRDDNIVLFKSTGFPDVTVDIANLDIKPEETGTTDAIIRGIAFEFAKRGRRIGGFSAEAVSSVLPGSGLSSSAALEILISRIFDGLFNEERTPMDPVEMAQIGQIAENKYFGKPCGLMDQLACSVGGIIAIDFKEPKEPCFKKLDFDFNKAGFALCVVNTGGSHANLTADYASIPKEMKSVASFFNKSVLREIDKGLLLDNAAEARKALGDRAFLRALHFFNENERVDAMSAALEKKDIQCYLENVNESGDSSWQLLQNVFSPQYPQEQGIALALALTKDFFKKQGLRSAGDSACRVHGGGFAGTIQAYIPLDVFSKYQSYMESIFGAGAVTGLTITTN